MLHARPAARAGRDDQPGGPAGKAYPFLRMRMMARIRRPLAYSFLRPRPQKRVRMHTIGDGRSRICPPLPGGDTRRVPVSATPEKRQAAKRTHFCGTARRNGYASTCSRLRRNGYGFSSVNAPTFAEMGTPDASVHTPSLWETSLFPAETGTARGPAAPRHITPSPHSGAFSDESCDTAGPLPRGRANNLHNRPAESGTAQISPE